MPELIYIGVCTVDEDNLDPAFVRADDGRFALHSAAEVASGVVVGFVNEYRLVRKLIVTKTVPAPVVEVTEVPQ
jgi:hypothetical protein